jgi:DNA-directed RNA polymerase specialized sigma24 family protein
MNNGICYTAVVKRQPQFVLKMNMNHETPLGQLNDEILITRVARREEAALEALYDRYAGIVLGISQKIVGDCATAEDILQETFWRVWGSAATYEPRRGSFKSWLLRIARNLSIDAYRRRNTRPQTMTEVIGVDSILDQLADPDMDVAGQAQTRPGIGQVWTALMVLPRWLIFTA